MSYFEDFYLSKGKIKILLNLLSESLSNVRNTYDQKTLLKAIDLFEKASVEEENIYAFCD